MNKQKKKSAALKFEVLACFVIAEYIPHISLRTMPRCKEASLTVFC